MLTLKNHVRWLGLVWNSADVKFVQQPERGCAPASPLWTRSIVFLLRVCGLSWATELWFLGRHCGSIMLKRNPTPLQPLSLKTQRLTSVKSRLIKRSTGERKDTYDFVVNCPFKLSILLNTDRISSKGERGFYSQQPIRKYSSVVQPSFRSVIKSISDTNKHTHTPTRPVCFTTNWRLCSNVTHIKGD